MPPESGAGEIRFGRYRLIEKLGAGGMAVVWRAVVDGPRGFSRSLVIKRIRHDLSSDTSFISMLASEARLCGLLHHPAIVQVHEFGEIDGEYYLAMEWVDGADLSLLVKRCRELERKPPLGAVCWLTAELLGALGYAHALTDPEGRSLEIVHRDVSPQNIVVTPLGVVKLLDFGVAKAASHVRDEHTRTGTLKGKISYMSPEQADGLPVDRRSDIFSLGIVLHELLTMERLFKGETDFETLRFIRRAEVTRTGIDPELDALVLKMLAREPQDRFASCGDALAALKPILHRLRADQDGLRQFLAELGPLGARAVRVETPTAYDTTRPPDEGDGAREPSLPHDANSIARKNSAARGSGARDRSKVGRDDESSAGDEPRPQTRPHFAARRRIPRAAFWIAGALALGAAGFAARRQLWPAHATTAAAPARLRRAVAVLGPQNRGARPEDAWISTALAELLRSELAAGDKLRVIPGELTDRSRVELALPGSDALPAPLVERFAASVGADVVVLGAYTLAPEASELRCELALRDANGETFWSASESGDPADLGALTSRMAARLRERLGAGAVTAAEAGLTRAALPDDGAAARLYVEGLEHLRRFELVEARDLLTRAAAAEPAHSLTHSALASAWSLLGYDKKSLEEARRAFELSSPRRRTEHLLAEARYREAAKEWDKAIEIYRALRTFYPDDLEYGLWLAGAETSAGDTARAFATLTELRALPAPDRNDARIDLLEARAAAAAGDFRRSRAAAAATVRVAGERHARLIQAMGFHYEGWALRNLGQLDEAAGAYEKSLATYRELGHQLGQAELLNDLAILRRDQGHLESARQMYTEALALHRKLERQKGVAQTLNNLAEVERLAGRVDDARGHYGEALTLARQTGDAFGQALVLGNLGELETGRGELGAGRRVYDEALALARGLGQKNLVAYLLYDVGELERAAGDAGAARRAHEEALAMRRATGEEGTIADSRVALARLALDEGRPADAEPLARQALVEFARQKSRSGEASARAALALALLGAGRTRDAREALGNPDALAGPDESPAARLELAIAAARVRSGGDAADRAAAAGALEAAAAEADRLGLVAPSLEARLASAELQLAAGPAAGRAALTALERDARRRGFLGIARRAAAPGRPPR